VPHAARRGWRFLMVVTLELYGRWAANLLRTQHNWSAPDCPSWEYLVMDLLEVIYIQKLCNLSGILARNSLYAPVHENPGSRKINKNLQKPDEMSQLNETNENCVKYREIFFCRCLFI
jgi:hypothetical protein